MIFDIDFAFVPLQRADTYGEEERKQASASHTGRGVYKQKLWGRDDSVWFLWF